MGGDIPLMMQLSHFLISIRTPAWGVTENFFTQDYARPDFNSHPRVGGDIRNVDEGILCKISIRTPAWGVTVLLGKLVIRNEFQFAPPRGG